MSSCDKHLGSIRSLRKLKMTELVDGVKTQKLKFVKQSMNTAVGWIKPSQPRFIKHTMNTLLTPRKICRHKALKKFTVNKRTSCISAIRMVNHEVKQWMRVTGGPLDFKNLNPKVICQIIAEWSYGTFVDKLPAIFDGKSMDQMVKMCEHRYSYSVNQKDRYYMPTDESYFSQYAEDEDATSKVIVLLLKIIKSKGGFANYMNESCFYRPDAMCAAQCSNKVARTWPHELGGCPGRVCQFCGVCNIYSHRDVPNKPMRSKNPHLPVTETYDDNYATEETTWSMENGKHVNAFPIAWRCGFCFGDLSVRPVHAEYHGTTEAVDQVVTWYVGFMLDELKSINATDFYVDGGSEIQKQTVISHDMSIAKRLISKLYNGVVTLPSNMPEQMFKRMRQLVPQVTMRKTIGANSVCPTLTAEINCLTGSMRSIFGQNTMTMYGSTYQPIDSCTEYDNFIDWLQVKNPTIDSKQLSKINGIGALTLEPESFITAANNLNGIYVICPLKEGHLFETRTSLIRDDIDTHLLINNKSTSLTLNSLSVEMMLGDVIKNGMYHNYIVEMQRGNFFRLVFVTNSCMVSPNNISWHDVDENISITLPLPTMADNVDGQLSIGIKCVTKELNVELLQALCIRNIQGKMQFNSLCEYAIAFNMRRYTTGKIVLKQQHIDYSVIHFHVFACLYTMKLQNNRLPFTKLLFETFNTEVLFSLIASVVNEVNKTFDMPNVVKQALHLIDDSSAILCKGSVPESLKYLHSAVKSNTKRSMVLFDLEKQILPPFMNICKHHKSTCKHTLGSLCCKCCGMPSKDIYCKCCAPQNYDKVIWGITTETAMTALFAKISALINSMKIKKINKQTVKQVATNFDTKTKSKKTRKGDIRKEDDKSVNSADVELADIISQILEGKYTLDQATKLFGDHIDFMYTEENQDLLMESLYPMLVCMLTNPSPTYYNVDGYKCALPFVGTDWTVVSNVKFKILDKVALSNFENNSCGFEALDYLFPNKLSRQDFKLLMGEPPYDETHLFHAAEQMGENLVLISVPSNTMHIAKFNFQSDIFFTIMFDEPAIETDIGHFSPVNVEFTESVRYYKCNPDCAYSLRAQQLKTIKKEEWLTTFSGTHEDNLSTEISISLMSRAQVSMSITQVNSVVLHDGTYIINSDVHDIGKHKFNFKMTMVPELGDAIALTNLSVDRSIFKSTLTIPSVIPTDLTQLHRLMIIDETLKILQGYRATLNKDAHNNVFFAQRKVIVGDLIQVHFKDIYLKPLDKVGLKSKNGSITMGNVVSTLGNASLISVPDHMAISNKFELLVSKTSYASSLMRICALQSASRNGQHLSMLLLNARCVKGYGGSGKSKEIISLRSKATAAITMTSSAKDNLINRGYSRLQCKTMERYTWDSYRNATQLFVDEANMMEYTDLSLVITNKIEKLYMYYDESQISKFDSISLQGISGLRLITLYPSVTENWCFSTRFGGKLNKALKKVLLDLEPNDKTETDFDIFNVGPLTPIVLKKLLEEVKVDVILNPYTIEVGLIKKMMKVIIAESADSPNLHYFEHIIVDKNHTYQSKECDNVMLIQWRSNTSDMNLCRKRKYVVSALTRARRAAYIAVSGYHVHVNTLKEAISMLAGSNFKIGTLQQCLEQDLVKTSEILNEALIPEMIQTRVINEELHLYRGNMYVGKYVKRDEQWKGESSIPTVGARLTSALEEPPGASVKVKIPNGVNVLLKNSTRVKALCWVNDMIINSGKLHLGGDMRNFIIKKGFGCPFMCSLTVYYKNATLLYVTDAWSGIERAVTYDEKSERATRICNWLKNEKCGYWIDKISFDPRMDTFMMIDRALTLPLASLNLVAGNERLSVDSSLSNAHWMNQVLTKYNEKSGYNWRSTVKHTMFVKEHTLSNRLIGTFYSIFTLKMKLKVNIWSNNDAWINFFNSAMFTVRPIMRRDKLIGTNYGMYVNPQTHIEQETTVGVFLSQQLFEQELRMKDQLAGSMAIATVNKDEANMVMKGEKLSSDFITHSAMCITTGISEIVDSYMLTLFGKQQEGCNIGYMGFNNHLIPVSNKHYIKVVRPITISTSVAWESTLEVANQWFVAFADRMQDVLKEKADELKTNMKNMTKEQKDTAKEMLLKLKSRTHKSLIIEDAGQLRDWTLIGVCAATLGIEELYEIVKNSSRTIVALPLNVTKNTIIDCSIPTMSADLNYKLIEFAKIGYIDLDDSRLQFNPIDSLDNFVLYNVNLIEIDDIVYNSNSINSQNPLISLRVPKIEITNITNKQALITVDVMNVDKRLMDRTLNYCIANSPTTDGILAYVRSLKSTYDTNRTGVFPTYNVNLEVAMNSAIAAMTLYKYNYNGVLSMANMVQYDVEFLNLLLNLQQQINKDGNINELFTGMVERGMKFLGVDIRKLLECVKEIEVALICLRPNPIKKKRGDNYANYYDSMSGGDGQHSESSDSDPGTTQSSKSGKGSKPEKEDTDSDSTSTTNSSKPNNKDDESGEIIYWERIKPTNKVVEEMEPTLVIENLAIIAQFADPPNVADDEISFYTAPMFNPPLHIDQSSTFPTMDTDLELTQESSEIKITNEPKTSNNSLDMQLLDSIDLASLLKLVDREFNCTNDTIWVLWEPNIDERQNAFVEKCLRHNSKSRFKMVLINSETDYKYVPKLLMEFKKHVTVQCWSDIVRMWLLTANGGIWVDATTIIDFTFLDPAEWLSHGKPGMMYYESVKDEEFVLDNWFICTVGNTAFFKEWFKIFMIIVKHGNDISAAKPTLDLYVDGVEYSIDQSETYLTMHQASRVALKICDLPNYVLLPGFNGPLGWITSKINMSEWVQCIVDGHYVPQGGALKLIGLSRQIAIEFETKTNRDFVEMCTNEIVRKDYLIIGCGTRGDVMSARGLASILQANNFICDVAIISNMKTDIGEIHIPIDIDLLALSAITKLSDVNEQLNFVKELFIKLTKKFMGTRYKYLVANMAMPCMAQLARLTGAMNINFTAMPTFDNSENTSYITMSIDNEKMVDNIINNLTFNAAKNLKLPWNSNTIINGKNSVIQWCNCEPGLIDHRRQMKNKFVIGNVIEGGKFSTTDDWTILQTLGREKVDILLAGPTVDGSIMSDMMKVMRDQPTRANKLIVIGKRFKQLSKKSSSLFSNKVKRHYSNVMFIDNMNLLTLCGKVNIMFSHGGQNTVNDCAIMGARSISYGNLVDQPYWNTVVPSLDGIEKVNVIDLCYDLSGKNTLPKFVGATALLKNNEYPVRPSNVSGNLGTSEITFIPLEVNNCVKACFEQHLRNRNLAWEQGASDLLKPYMTEDEIVLVAFMQRLNLNLIRNNVATNWTWFTPLSNCINIELTESGTMLHANLANWQSGRQMWVQRDIPVIAQLSKTLNLSFNCMHNCEVANILNLIQNKRWSNFVNLSPHKVKILHTMNTRVLDIRSGRVRRSISKINLTGKDGLVNLIDEGKLVFGKLYVVLCGTVVCYGIALVGQDNAAMLLTSQEVFKPDAICIDAGCRLYNDGRPGQLRTTEVKHARPLNMATRSHVIGNTMSMNYELTMASSQDTDIMVYDYDNRGHDKYDEALILAQAEVIHWLGEQPTENDLEAMKISHGLPERTVYKNGKMAVRFDFPEQRDKFLIRAMAVERQLPYAVQRGVTITGRLLENDKLDLHNLLHNEVPSEFNVNKNIVKKEKEEWLNLLGIPGHMWEEWSSKYTTQNGDKYHTMIYISSDFNPERGSFDDITTMNYTACSSHTCYASSIKAWCTKPRKGGLGFVDEEKISLGNSKDWWKKVNDEPTILKELTPNPLIDTFCDTTETLDDSKWGSRLKMMSTFENDPVTDVDIDFDLRMEGLNNDMKMELTPHEIQNLWINRDLTMDLRQYAPMNIGTIRSKENPDKISVTNKILLNNEYPLESRPILTKWTFEEHRSIAGRLFSKLKLRHKTKTTSVSQRLEKLVKCYFEPTFVSYQTAEQLLDVDAFETMLWISKRKDGIKIAQELNDLMTNELGLIPLNAINVHMKLESLMKENPIMHWGQHQARAIYWQRKAIAAISSPIFLKAKTRLKNSLRPKFIYADGLTPMELTYKTRQMTNVQWFFENDLSKQDRQTDKPLIDVEMEMYKLLGVAETVIKWWRTMHENWKFKARWNRGTAAEMRLTGQSTTSIGNLITNMQVHNDFILRNYNKIKGVLMLGDDILILSDSLLDTKNLSKETKQMHNMTSKQRVSQDSGLFCCMIAYNNGHGGVDLGPDYLRMKNRFEVTNGVSEASPENINARVQSYACMLGATKEMLALRRKNNWNIPLTNWYTSELLTKAIADRYEVTEYEVLANYDTLVSYLNNPIQMAVEFKTYVNVKVY